MRSDEKEELLWSPDVTYVIKMKNLYNIYLKIVPLSIILANVVSTGLVFKSNGNDDSITLL
jgi:hypothetical protein